MKSAGKRCRKGVITVAVLAGLGLASPGSPAAESNIQLTVPEAAAPRFGVAAHWPRWTLAAPAVSDPPASEAPPPPSDPTTADADSHPSTESSATPVATVPSADAGGPPPEPEPPAPSAAPPAGDATPSAPAPPAAPPPPAAAADAPTPASSPRPLTLQPSLVQRELLSRTFQRVTKGEVDLSGLERRELALRALTELQLVPGKTVPTGDPLRQIGVERRRLGGAFALVEGRAAAMEMTTVRGRGGEIRRQQWQVGDGEKPSLRLSLVDADADFDRFDALTGDEKAWVGAMRGMRRLEFGGERLSLAGGKADLGLLNLTDGKSRARRMSLGFTGSRWSLRALSQRADESFQRLGDLTDADRKLFGAERGISRDVLDLGYAFDKTRKLAASSLSLKASSGGAVRRQFEYSGGPNLTLSLDTGRVDTGFDRLGDLLAPDKKALSPRKGTSWSDWTANFSPTRWLATENRWLRSTNLETGRQTTQLRNVWSLQLASKSKLTLLRNLVETPTGDSGQTRALTQSVRLEQWLTNALFFSGLQEMTRHDASEGTDRSGRKLALQLKTGPKMKWQGAVDYNTASTSEGKAERVMKWTLGLPLRKGLSLQAKSEERQTEEGAGPRLFALGLNGKLAKAWDLALTLNSADPGKGPGTRDFGLRLAFAGINDTKQLKETRVVLGLGDTEGLPSAIPGQKGKKNSQNGTPARSVRTVTLESKWQGRPVAIGYAASAGTAGGLIYRLSTDPKRWLHLEALREVRDLGRTSLVARERYAVQARLARSSQVTFSYETPPEQSPGKLQFGHAQTKAEARTKLGGLEVAAGLAWDRDQEKGNTYTLTTLSVAGSLDSQNNLQLSYTGRSGAPNDALPVREFRLTYERKPDESLAIALHADWRICDGKHPDELAWQLDLTALF